MAKTPHHLGIIIDGNRRWAKERGLPTLEGHRKGFKKIEKLLKWCLERGIKILTLFVFSTENWKRSKKEVDYLMGLFKQSFSKENVGKINKEGIRIKAIGQRKKLPSAVQKLVKEAEESTEKNEKMILNFALSYGGRTEIIEAVKNIIRRKISPDKISEDTIKKNLWTSDVDLIIRTGKEQRISNFLIWQAAYSELYFSPKYWPDFNEKDLDKALEDYALRHRRFGK